MNIDVNLNSTVPININLNVYRKNTPKIIPPCSECDLVTAAWVIPRPLRKLMPITDTGLLEGACARQLVAISKWRETVYTALHHVDNARIANEKTTYYILQWSGARGDPPSSTSTKQELCECHLIRLGISLLQSKQVGPEMSEQDLNGR